MWNTCLIGRRWKPREGGSRPVLTGDGDIAAHSPSLVWGWVRVFAAAGLLATRSVVPVVTKRCSRPLSGSRTVTARAGGGAWVVFPFGRSGFPLGVRAVGGGFCGGHGPGVTPGPFPNPEAKAWHGDGTAPGRVWESNTPPQTFLVGFPVEPTLRETPPFFVSGFPCFLWGVFELRLVCWTLLISGYIPNTRGTCSGTPPGCVPRVFPGVVWCSST